MKIDSIFKYISWGKSGFYAGKKVIHIYTFLFKRKKKSRAALKTPERKVQRFYAKEKADKKRNSVKCLLKLYAAIFLFLKNKYGFL